MKAPSPPPGIAFDREQQLEYGAFNRRSGGYNATQRLLRRSWEDLPTALCAGSATMLMGTFEAILDRGSASRTIFP